MTQPQRPNTLECSHSQDRDFTKTNYKGLVRKIRLIETFKGLTFKEALVTIFRF